MVFAVSLGLIAVATFMFFGWGWAFRRMLGLERGTWPANVALGMAAVVFAGGILNLLRIAYPAALAAVAGIGILFAILALRQGVSVERPPIVVALLIATILIFTVATELPPSMYNFHDDFQKYFAYPVRMVETGTVFGSSLSAMGLQTLGAQAFLDGFVVAFFPIQFINGVDAVFGLFLCLILAAQVTENRKDVLAMTVVCVLGVVFINPQYVNISTLYCGSALVMAIAAASVENSGPSPAVLGLLYAALIAMKPIFIVFAAIHLLAIALSSTGGIQAGVRWAFRTGLAAAIFLLPWALVNAPNYLHMSVHRTPVPVATAEDSDMFSLFSLRPLEYGSTAANYTALVAAIGICGLICWRVKPAARKMIACCAAGVVTFFVFVYVMGPMNYGYEHALRYYTAVAIGLAPAVFGSTALLASRFESRTWRLWLPLMVATLPLAAFGSSLRTRVVTSLTAHTASSLTWLTQDANYMEYNRRVLYGPERQAVKALQEQVPPGETMLAWINTPFYLDYRRNRIIDIDTAGIGTPWAEMPAAHYLIWDYAGFASLDQEDYEGHMTNAGANERRDSVMTIEFMKRLDGMAGDVLYDNGEVKVVRLRNR
jgi:hypothetical protein